MSVRSTTVFGPALVGARTASAAVAPDAASRRFGVRLDLAMADLSAADNAIDLAIERSDDGGASWTALVSGGWQGGTIGRDGRSVAPQIGIGAGDSVPLLRIVIDPSRAQTVTAILDEDGG